MEKENKKSNKTIIIIVSIVCALALAITVLLIWYFKSRHNTFEGNYAELVDVLDPLEIEVNYVFTDYDDFYEKTKSDILREKDFKNNNYVIVQIENHKCASLDIEVTNYNVEDDKLNFQYTYYEGCGVCAPTYYYYMVPVEKDITKIVVNKIARARNNAHCSFSEIKKPMIYLYSQEETVVTIELGYPELLTTTYPKYESKWEVVAYPNGDLKARDGKTYYGLYWEGLNDIDENFEDGFVVSKDNLVSFFEEKLSILGLSEREANEFIVYWLPILEKNDYNLIRFAKIDEIDKLMPLDVNPKPDSIIRILMEYKPLSENKKIKEQKLKTPIREGFTLVEWGGTEIK